MLLDTQLLGRVFNFWPSFLLHGWPMGDCGYEKAFKNYRASYKCIYWYYCFSYLLLRNKPPQIQNSDFWLHSSLGWLGSAGWVFCCQWLELTHTVAYSWELCHRRNAQDGYILVPCSSLAFGWSASILSSLPGFSFCRTSLHMGFLPG